MCSPQFEYLSENDGDDVDEGLAFWDFAARGKNLNKKLEDIYFAWTNSEMEVNFFKKYGKLMYEEDPEIISWTEFSKKFPQTQNNEK